MRRRVGRLGVVQIVGGHQRQAEVLGQPQQFTLGLPLDRQAVVHDLGVEVAGAEYVPQLGSGGAGGGILADPQFGLHLAADAPGGADQPTRVGREQLSVDPRLEVVPLQRGERAHPEEVVHAAGGAGQHGHVRVGPTATDIVLVGWVVPEPHPGLVGAVGARGDVCLDTDDRGDAPLAGLGPELVGPEDVAVVGRRDGRHTHRHGRVEQLVDARGTVEHGVLGVHVQVRETALGGRGVDIAPTVCRPTDAPARVAARVVRTIRPGPQGRAQGRSDRGW